MNDILLNLLLIIGVIVGWQLGGEKLRTSTVRIEHKNLLSYLLGE